MLRPRKYFCSYFLAGIFIPVAIALAGFDIISLDTGNHKKPQHCRTIAFPGKKDNYLQEFNTESIPKMRKFRTFYLSAGAAKNKITLEMARRALNQIKNNRDTIHGIDIVMSQETQYEDFMKAMDHCDERFPNASAPIDNHIYAFYVRVDTTNIPKDVLEKWCKKYGRL